MNSVNLTGRITKDPELKKTASGKDTISFTLAVDRQIKDANGNKQTDFIPCVVWNQTAVYMSQWVRKGDLLETQGKIQTRNYQDQNGKTVYVTEVICDRVSKLASAGNQQTLNQAQVSNQEQSMNEISDDDLPF